MTLADLDGDKIIVEIEYRDRDLIRQVPGATWNPKGMRWQIPVSWGACKTLRGVFGQRLEIGPALSAWAFNELDTRIRPALDLRLATDGDGDDRLFPFQKPGVQFLALTRQCLLADEMGTGKTIQTIMAARRLVDLGENPFPVLCIVPNSMKITWQKEFEKWLPEVTVVVIKGSAAKRRKAFDEITLLSLNGTPVVGVINWESVRLHSRLAPYGSIRLSDEEKREKELNTVPWRTVVADEAHKLKDPKSKQTRATWAVGHQQTVEFRYALTGTPLANAPDDLWAIMHFVAPREYPSKTRYVDRYCMLTLNTFGGMEVVGVRPDTREEFYSILDPRMRRMPKELVLPFLPPKLRSVRYAEMSAKQAKAYREIEDGMVTRLDDGSMVLTTNSLSRNTRLIQFSSSYATVDEAGDVKLMSPSNKVDELLDILDELGDEPVVVAAESRQLIELARERLDDIAAKNRAQAQRFTYRMIVGGMTDEQREANKEDFQQGRARIMLMTIKAGGVGMTLTRAGVIVFLQRSWSMLDNKQSEDRVHRIGSEQHDKILIIDIVAPGTVEELQIARLHEKADRLEEIVRDKETLKAKALRYEDGQVVIADPIAWQEITRLEKEAESIEQEPLWA